MPETPWTHTSVLLTQTVDALVTSPNGLYIDATFGRGGHTRELLSRLAVDARVIAFDRDLEAVAAAQALVQSDPRFSIIHAPFSQMQQHLAPHSVTGIMADLGISSPQVDDATRGMSFMRDGPLDMRMDLSSGEPVRDWLARASEQHIAEVLHDYGDERHARRIAAAIVKTRETKTKSTDDAASQAPPKLDGRSTLDTTGQLARLIQSIVPRDKSGHHPATRSFQALRIFANDELGEIDRALDAALSLLEPLGRLAVISFHSLEDRRVKQFISLHSKPQAVDRRSPAFALQDLQANRLRLRDLGRVLPSDAETKANPRARSAVLRVAARTEVGVETGVGPRVDSAEGAS